MQPNCTHRQQQELERCGEGELADDNDLLPAASLQQGYMLYIKQGSLHHKQSVWLRHLVMAARRELLPALGRPTMPTSATTCTAARTGLST